MIQRDARVTSLPPLVAGVVAAVMTMALAFMLWPVAAQADEAPTPVDVAVVCSAEGVVESITFTSQTPDWPEGQFLIYLTAENDQHGEQLWSGFLDLEGEQITTTVGQAGDWFWVEATNSPEATLMWGQVTCPAPDPGPQPSPDVEYQTIELAPDCDARTVTSLNQENTREYVLVDGVWVPGEWSGWVTVSQSTRDATTAECPLPEPDPTDPPGNGNAPPHAGQPGPPPHAGVPGPPPHSKGKAPR